MAFNSIEDAIRNVLLNDVDLAALVSTRVHTDHLPQNPTFPAITVQNLTSDIYGDNQGNWELEKTPLQIDVWAADSISRAIVSEALRLAISGYTGEPLGVKIRGVEIQSRRNFYQPEVDNYRKIHRVICWHKEVTPDE